MHPDSNTYTGGFVDGLPHGEGLMAYSNGDRCAHW